MAREKRSIENQTDISTVLNSKKSGTLLEHLPRLDTEIPSVKRDEAEEKALRKSLFELHK